MNASSQTFRRESALAALAAERFDVLVIGGGITGAGVALDAAARGLRTALVERRDFASGTSSKSSKMVHGGLRYLQQREVRLVYENLGERHRLLRNAPHLVEPLPFLIPLWGNDGVVSSTVARAYSSALWLYDLTGGIRIGHRHRRVSKAEALAHLPTLRTDRLVAGFLYFDARADDARLTLTIARTAVLDHGAVAANYTPVTSLLRDASGRVGGACVAAPEPIEVRADAVVNATGVWADDIRALDEGSHPGSIRPAKGIHLTVPRSRLPCDIAAVLPVPNDRRSIFVVPWGEEVYLGTTDTDYKGSLDDPECSPEDVDYVLGAVNHYVGDGPTAADVTGVWAGLRPLLAEDVHGRVPSARTADLSRRHQVTVSPSGLVNVTGGKLTTYRKMAADTVDDVVSLLGRGARRTPTKSLALRGAGPPAAAADPTSAHLWSRYGTEAGAVAGLAAHDESLGQPLVEGLPYLAAEAVHAVREEMARTLDDVLARRTRALLHRAAATIDAAPRVAALIGPELGWDEAERAVAVEAFVASARGALAAAGVGGGP